MAKVTFQLQGLPAVERKINRAVNRMASRLGTEVRQALQSKTPVRTGRARKGWTKQTKGKNIRIQNRVPYVPFLEKGTSRMRAANNGRGIIGPALQLVKRTKIK